MVIVGWTIYRDAIQKPKFRVSVAIKSIVQRGRKPVGPDIFVEALNLGPIANRFGIVVLRESWWKRRANPRQRGFLYPDNQHMGTSPAAERIEVGDRGTL